MWCRRPLQHLESYSNFMRTHNRHSASPPPEIRCLRTFSRWHVKNVWTGINAGIMSIRSMQCCMVRAVQATGCQKVNKCLFSCEPLKSDYLAIVGSLLRNNNFPSDWAHREWFYCWPHRVLWEFLEVSFLQEKDFQSRVILGLSRLVIVHGLLETIYAGSFSIQMRHCRAV